MASTLNRGASFSLRGPRIDRRRVAGDRRRARSDRRMVARRRQRRIGGRLDKCWPTAVQCCRLHHRRNILLLSDELPTQRYDCGHWCCCCVWQCLYAISSAMILCRILLRSETRDLRLVLILLQYYSIRKVSGLLDSDSMRSTVGRDGSILSSL